MFIDIGKSARRFLVHICSPRTLRVAHEDSSFGGGNNRGLSKNQATTEIAWRQLRFQTGTYTSGLVNTRVHTLQGFECLSHVCSFMIAIHSPFQVAYLILGLDKAHLTRTDCWSGVRLLVNSAYPTAPHTIPNTIPSLPLATISFETSPRGKPTMSSTPRHHGSTRARRVVAPRSAEPMSTAAAPIRRTR